MKKALFFIVCLCFAINMMAQTKTITGVVVDATGEPVIGASVLEVGTTNGTITDVDGNFTIQVPVGAKLDVSYIGYKTQQIVVGVPNTYKVILKEDAEMLDEVVVTGYGMSQKRSLMTNSISKLDDKVLQNAAMSNAAQSLQGTVSGLRVTNTSGKPGSSPNIVLRGGASINKNLEGPLVVVDGLVRSMDDINPSDIESIQVLKDAASTAIYGARANNGVILLCLFSRTAVLDFLLTIFRHSFNYFLPVLPTLRLITSSAYLIPLPLYGSGLLLSLISAAYWPTFSLSIPLTIILLSSTTASSPSGSSISTG